MTNPETKIPIPEREMPQFILTPEQIANGYHPDDQQNPEPIGLQDDINLERTFKNRTAAEQKAFLERVKEKLRENGVEI
ncbi:hypothetical protein KKG71_05105 [Patescibacteria group bacterium]|nr:hypothetical protein [Patescibacteria group bacterium]